MRFSTLAPFVLAASLSSSCISPLADPSLLATEPYRPEIWNGKLSNEKLADIFLRHGAKIEAIADHQFKGNDEIVFSRKSHAPYEKTLWLIDRIQTLERLKVSPQETAKHFGISEQTLASIAPELIQAGKLKRFQDNSNCYAYPLNFGDKNKKEGNPGDHTLESPLDWDTLFYTKDFNLFISKVIEGATSDGLIYTGEEAPSRKGFYRIAFYARPVSPDIKEEIKENQSNEFHFARQNRDGTWSHKYGSYNVMNTDYSGKIITDAKTADMGDYRFIGYFMAPEGGIPIGYRMKFVMPPKRKYEDMVAPVKASEIVVTAPEIK